MSVQSQPKKTLKEIIADEYRRCAFDPIYFMRKYCMIQHPTRGKIPFHLYKFQEECLTDFKDNRFNYVIVDAKVEDDLKDFEGEEKEEMRKELNAHDNGVNNLIKAGFNLLGLESYLTTGEVETRAWTIKKGSTAPVAAAAIHTDFEKKFIRAEVVSYNDLVAAGSFAKAKESGKLRTEGKEYIVKDGDVIEFKI